MRGEVRKIEPVDLPEEVYQPKLLKGEVGFHPKKSRSSFADFLYGFLNGGFCRC